MEIIKNFHIKKDILIKSINNFKGLDYRQQIIYKKNQLIIINDSKSTSYSSSEDLLKTYDNIHWIIGGIPKKKDKLDLPNKYFKNIRVYVFGKNYKKFINDLRNKARLKKFQNLKRALDAVMINIKKNKFMKNTILFSPASASFDSFKNFEDRGLYFSELIKRCIDERKIS